MSFFGGYFHFLIETMGVELNLWRMFHNIYIYIYFYHPAKKPFGFGFYNERNDSSSSVFLVSCDSMKYERCVI